MHGLLCAFLAASISYIGLSENSFPFSLYLGPEHEIMFNVRSTINPILVPKPGPRELQRIWTPKSTPKGLQSDCTLLQLSSLEQWLTSGWLIDDVLRSGERVLLVNVEYEYECDGLNCSPGKSRVLDLLTIFDPEEKKRLRRYVIRVDEKLIRRPDSSEKSNSANVFQELLDAKYGLDDFSFLAMVPYHPYFDLVADYVTNTLRYSDGPTHGIAYRRRLAEVDGPRREKNRVAQKESRAIVTRQRGAARPTWDGDATAYVFHPIIWYFDPNSRQRDGTLEQQTSIIRPEKEMPSTDRFNLFECWMEVERPTRWVGVVDCSFVW